MKLTKASQTVLVASVAAGITAGLVGQTFAGRPTVTAMDSTLKSVFAEINTPYQVRKDEDGSTTFVFNVGTVTGQLYQFLGEDGRVETLKLNVGYDLEKAPALTAINTFNERRRFGKAFLDVDGDPFLVSDIDVQSGITAGTLKAWLVRFRAIVPLFEMEVIKGLKPADPAP
jgi:hypothetical protein